MIESMFEKFTRRVRLQIAGVSFISINMDFQFKRLIHAHQHPLKAKPARTAYFQPHLVTTFYPIEGSILRRHMHMPQSSNHSFRHFKKTGRAH